ncbi:unnamed protein product [Arctogadus glacialis]
MAIIFCAVLIMSSPNIVNRLAAVDIGDNEQHGWMLYWLQGMRIGAQYIVVSQLHGGPVSICSSAISIFLLLHLP